MTARALHTFESTQPPMCGTHLCEGSKPFDQPKGNETKCTAGKRGHATSRAALACTDTLQVLAEWSHYFWFWVTFCILYCGVQKSISPCSWILNRKVMWFVVSQEPSWGLRKGHWGQSVKNRARLGAPAWSSADVTNFCQAGGLAPEKVPPDSHHISVTAATAVWHCTVQWGGTEHHWAKIWSTQGAPFLAPFSQIHYPWKKGCPREDPQWCDSTGKNGWQRTRGHCSLHKGFLSPVNENLMKTLIFENDLFSSDL